MGLLGRVQGGRDQLLQGDAQDHLQVDPGPEGGACSRHDECQKSNIMYEIIYWF